MSQVILAADHTPRVNSVRRGTSSRLSADDLLRHEGLGTQSAYRVVAVCGPTVEVEVVGAPGVTPGTRMRITLRAARAMRCETVGVPRESHGRHRRSGRRAASSQALTARL